MMVSSVSVSVSVPHRCRDRWNHHGTISADDRFCDGSIGLWPHDGLPGTVMVSSSLFLHARTCTQVADRLELAAHAVLIRGQLASPGSDGVWKGLSWKPHTCLKLWEEREGEHCKPAYSLKAERSLSTTASMRADPHSIPNSTLLLSWVMSFQAGWAK